jgi:hypothetical protein
MIVLDAGGKGRQGKGKQVWGAGSKKSPRRMSRKRETFPLPTLFIWDRGQRHEAIEQAPTKLRGLVKNGMQTIRPEMAA